MKHPPALTQKQFDLIDRADFAQLYIWYNELAPAKNTNSEISKLYNYLNEKMKEKA